MHMGSKLNLDFKLVEQARAHASRVADDVQRFIDGCTTVAVERTVCRLLGIDGVSGGSAPDTTGENELGVPLPNVVVDHLQEKGAWPRARPSGWATPWWRPAKRPRSWLTPWALGSWT